MTADPSMVQMGDAFLSSGGHQNVRQTSGFHCVEFSLSRFCLEHSLGEFEDILRSNDFNSIPALASITKEDLVAMGITKLGSQRKIDLGLQALRIRYEDVFRDTFGGQLRFSLSRVSLSLSRSRSISLSLGLTAFLYFVYLVLFLFRLSSLFPSLNCLLSFALSLLRYAAEICNQDMH